MLTVLKSRMAYCVSVGAQIGEAICESARKLAEEPLYRGFPEHKQWVDFGLRTGSYVLGILISRILLRVVNAYNTSLL